ncbi:MAG: DUF4349 domain-containing protein [Ktedonobacteraceae bacterium]
MPHIRKNYAWSTSLCCGLLLLCLLVAACGGATPTASNSASAGASIPQPQAHSANQQKNSSTVVGQQYLIKSLNITMEVKDTQRVATDLQAWLGTTDPLATADSINYQQVGGNLYNISMVFSVQATLYPRIENYLNNYPQLHNGRLISTNKTTQDVSTDYIDTQSRLKNLRGEQERLLTLLSHAQVLGDILAIDQRLTDVEGQIEQIEAHLNQLNSQTSFYTITVNLQPGQAAVSPAPAAWSIGQIWQNAVAAAVAFAQVLATFLIWLLVFSVYIVPVALIVWFVRRWRRLRSQRLVPPIVTPPPSQVASYE